MVEAPVTSKVELRVVALDTVKVSFTFNVLSMVEAPPTCNIELSDTSWVTRKFPWISNVNDASVDANPPIPVLLFTLPICTYWVVIGFSESVLSTWVTVRMPLSVDIELVFPSESTLYIVPLDI